MEPPEGFRESGPFPARLILGIRFVGPMAVEVTESRNARWGSPSEELPFSPLPISAVSLAGPGFDRILQSFVDLENVAVLERVAEVTAVEPATAATEPTSGPE
jgi:hypothetical protein